MADYYNKEQWWKDPKQNKEKQEQNKEKLKTVSSGPAQSETAESKKATLASEAGKDSQLEYSKTSPIAPGPQRNKEKLKTVSSGAAESLTPGSQKATLASKAGKDSQLESSKTLPTAPQRNKEQLKKESSGATESQTAGSQKVTLASKAGKVSQLEYSKTSPTAPQRNKEQLKKVQPEQVTQEQVTQVLLSWVELEASNKASNQDYQSAINKIKEVVEDIIKFPKLQEFTNFPKVLTDHRNKYCFAWAVENMVKKVLASQISDSEELSKFLSTYSFYFVHRQALLKAAAEIYPEYRIGIIWA